MDKEDLKEKIKTADEEVETIVEPEFAIIKTEIEDENHTRVIIKNQCQTGFQYKFKKLEDGNVEQVGTFRGIATSKSLCIQSVNCIQWNDGDFDFFMLGDSDIIDARRGKRVSVVINNEDWSYIKKALELLGAEIDKEEQPETSDELPTIDYTINEIPTDEDIKEMIDKVDLETFCKLIKNRLTKELDTHERTSLKDVNEDWAKEYLKDWAKSKFKFYRILGNNLSVNKDVENCSNIDELASAIKEIRAKFPLYAPIFDRVGTRCYVDKKAIRECMNDGFFSDKKVKNGMSITKFFSLYKNEQLNIELSKMYQDIGKNTIYISIDPIDYLTVSINASGWESCHHFIKGCYRNAGLSYMNDEVTLIAYASKNKVNYNFDFPYEWNTKNWRQMIYMSKENSITVFSRQYPYDSDMTKDVRRLFEDLVSTYFNSSNMWKVFNNVDNISYLDVRKDYYYLGYNDVSNGYSHKVIKAKDDKAEAKAIEIGAEVYSLFDRNLIIRGSESCLIPCDNSDEDDDDEFERVA